MGRLIYTSITSLDGYFVDDRGNFDWAEPDEEVHRFVNDHERRIGLQLYGRRLYETMVVWQEDDWLQGEPEAVTDYAQIWRSADKVVFSTTLEQVTTPRTTLQRTFDPAVVRELVARSPTDVNVGGAELAAAALAADLVDELQVFVNPVVVGGGRSWLPLGRRIDLTLLEERRFANGVVHTRYDVRR